MTCFHQVKLHICSNGLFLTQLMLPSFFFYSHLFLLTSVSFFLLRLGHNTPPFPSFFLFPILSFLSFFRSSSLRFLHSQFLLFPCFSFILSFFLSSSCQFLLSASSFFLSSLRGDGRDGKCPITNQSSNLGCDLHLDHIKMCFMGLEFDIQSLWILCGNLLQCFFIYKNLLWC